MSNLYGTVHASTCFTRVGTGIHKANFADFILGFQNFYNIRILDLPTSIDLWNLYDILAGNWAV
jgi:hypothetical protein